METISSDAQEVLASIKSGTPVRGDMPDWKIWHAEDELSRAGLIYRDEVTGDWVAR